MNGKAQQEPKPIRLVFELARADNPRLYDELVRFPQGAKRVNRLRVLAYDGLLAQYGVFTSVGAGVMPASARIDTVAAGSAAVTNAVFEPGFSE
ncbi:hypothetical protein C1I89_30010 [Achromobacter pulmonis]|uniref:Uncharacterized protein n=1 Tax=Achromobacter pulmonis TaxID=1389932 RepID=A0A2N8K9S1_9BURK|nr:hypothetical protein [Achromobacter pulmonis]PND30204.1 hypothetical protein C1I89_30010 [Achromobacter pulmonis]